MTFIPCRNPGWRIAAERFMRRTAAFIVTASRSARITPRPTSIERAIGISNKIGPSAEAHRAIIFSSARLCSAKPAWVLIWRTSRRARLRRNQAHRRQRAPARLLPRRRPRIRQRPPQLLPHLRRPPPLRQRRLHRPRVRLRLRPLRQRKRLRQLRPRRRPRALPHRHLLPRPPTLPRLPRRLRRRPEMDRRHIRLPGIISISTVRAE